MKILQHTTLKTTVSSALVVALLGTTIGCTAMASDYGNQNYGNQNYGNQNYNNGRCTC